MKPRVPQISVITVALNAARGLQKTMNSILGQDYPRVEFIVIDGGSTDGTVEVIRSHAGHLAYWVSEPDKGIYDAMNKGLAVAKGEWVNFMNAGDTFFDSRVLADVFNQEVAGAEVIYGDSIACYPAFKTMRKALPVENLWKGMVCCHQAVFFRTELIKDEAYKPGQFFSADYELILRLYEGGKSFRYVPKTMAVFDTRGASNVQMVKSARSNLEILRSRRKLTCKETWFHQGFICLSKLTEWSYKHWPPVMLHAALKLLYRSQIIHEPHHP